MGDIFQSLGNGVSHLDPMTTLGKGLSRLDPNTSFGRENISAIATNPAGTTASKISQNTGGSGNWANDIGIHGGLGNLMGGTDTTSSEHRGILSALIAAALVGGPMVASSMGESSGAAGSGAAGSGAAGSVGGSSGAGLTPQGMPMMPPGGGQNTPAYNYQQAAADEQARIQEYQQLNRDAINKYMQMVATNKGN